MQRLSLAIIAMSALVVPAFAQGAKPLSRLDFGKVPKAAVLSGDVIGLTATNAKNENVGEIKDLVMDHDKLVGYVLSVGGFLGMGEHYVEVKPTSIAIDYDASAKKWKAMINASKEQLKAAPEFTYDDRLKH